MLNLLSAFICDNTPFQSLFVGDSAIQIEQGVIWSILQLKGVNSKKKFLFVGGLADILQSKSHMASKFKKPSTDSVCLEIDQQNAIVNTAFDGENQQVNTIEVMVVSTPTKNEIETCTSTSAPSHHGGDIDDITLQDYGEFVSHVDEKNNTDREETSQQTKCSIECDSTKCDVHVLNDSLKSTASNSDIANQSQNVNDTTHNNTIDIESTKDGDSNIEVKDISLEQMQRSTEPVDTDKSISLTESEEQLKGTENNLVIENNEVYEKFANNTNESKEVTENLSGEKNTIVKNDSCPGQDNVTTENSPIDSISGEKTYIADNSQLNVEIENSFSKDDEIIENFSSEHNDNSQLNVEIENSSCKDIEIVENLSGEKLSDEPNDKEIENSFSKDIQIVENLSDKNSNNAITIESFSVKDHVTDVANSVLNEAFQGDNEE